ncbi:hypothetical protein PPYR_05649 [Photinus pyralis]|uniref:Uncharacterized protein n=1 Tax=Photinus pyralis TaxID=7054 RepID=A0A1Y1LSP9_PHOPY|nr:sarcalumenin isoform X2 [Photinus pyralis]KAB0801295.1 hypothetical protein PPYR_05649 [Photinus pyralis]
MEVCWRSSWQIWILFGVLILSARLQGVRGELEAEGPSESECRPHIEKALKQLEAADNVDITDSTEEIPTIEISDDSTLNDGDDEDYQSITTNSDILSSPYEYAEYEHTSEQMPEESTEADDGLDSFPLESDVDSIYETRNEYEQPTEIETDEPAEEEEEQHAEEEEEQQAEEEEEQQAEEEEEQQAEEEEEQAEVEDEKGLVEEPEEEDEALPSSKEQDQLNDDDEKDLSKEGAGEVIDENVEEDNEEISNDDKEDDNDNLDDLSIYVEERIIEEISNDDPQSRESEDSAEKQVETETIDEVESEIEKSSEPTETESAEVIAESIQRTIDVAEEPKDDETVEENEAVEESVEMGDQESVVEELIEDDEEEVELRPRDHVAQLLKLGTESEDFDKVSEKNSEILLRDLKKLYENAIRPLETLYKYRDLSNRHFGDSEIFSKPLILFMGPWSGGKSTIINYLLDIENKEINLHTGAEPSPAYFNILMYGEEPEILDGTELAADYTFSGLQKFGQGLEERLKGYKIPSKLLEKVNIVEIPGILEVRKQVSRIFPFNDACQWFIDRADIIFLVYDPSKLDVGPETEAILDQLKGREHQTRILLNKADQVKPEELMRVQGALIWNISPLMSSAQPPVMYTTSLWSRPYEQWAPVRLLQAQERAFLRDLRTAIDKRIDNKIASARRFAVRVRNHAKMVDCYLTTYYNHKSVFGNRKQVSDEIINHPQDYHIYEGLSTLTNISRYDLPDPDVYKDFFRLNALYDFQQLSSTCTYFRGCPINRLDVAIAYDLPELVGKHKRLTETAFSETVAATKTPIS